MKTTARTSSIGILAGLLLACALAFTAPAPAHAETVDELKDAYIAAVANFETAVAKQEDNTAKISKTNDEIVEVKKEIAQNEDWLNEVAVQTYKLGPESGRLINMLLNATTIDEALESYDGFRKMQTYYADAVQDYKDERQRLEHRLQQLEVRKLQLEQEVANTKAAAEAAEKKWRSVYHADGAQFHQTQGTSNNCGAAAFTVGVNILLHEARFENVSVWKGPGFEENSTANLAGKGAIWLAANGLTDEIGVEAVPGDIHNVDELRQRLEDGQVVVISSGPGSVWHFADGSAKAGLFNDGHWIVFYYYEDGVFYANDSSQSKELGAGCPYDTDAMQQWLNGRGNHFATAIYHK